MLSGTIGLTVLALSKTFLQNFGRMDLSVGATYLLTPIAFNIFAIGYGIPRIREMVQEWNEKELDRHCMGRLKSSEKLKKIMGPSFQVQYNIQLYKLTL
jgi:hypothetical protein